MTRLQWLQAKAGRGGRAGRGSREEKWKPIDATEDKEYTLDLFAPIPKTLKPCGFTGDTLTESAWLPYKDKDRNVVLRPAIIMTKPDMQKDKPFKIVDYMKGFHDIKGTFPTQDLNTLMSVKAVQMLEHMAEIEPQTVDTDITGAFQKHLSIPKPEMIVAKRWIEGTFFYDIFDAYPIQSILGVSESGKSRLC